MKNLLFLCEKIFFAAGVLFWTAIVIIAAPLTLRTDNWVHSMQSVAIVAILLLLVALVIYYSLRFKPRHGQQSAEEKFWLPVGSTLICAVVWSVYGVVFYPGLISWDFFVQWYEMSGKLPRSDWHPFFHTCIIWLLTRIWYSPAIIMLAQIFFMSVSIGVAAWSLQRIKVPNKIVLIVVLFYAFFPLNGFYAISLWKDIGYSISFLWLTVLVVDIVSSEGKALEKREMFISFLIALFFIALMRHNGIVPAFGLLFILAVFYRDSQLKVVSFLTITLFVFIILFKVFALGILDVDIEKKNILKSQLLTQHIGSVLNAESKITVEEKIFLSNIIPIHYWKKAYNPLSCMPLSFGKDGNGKGLVNEDFLKKNENYNYFIKIWRRIAIRNYYSIIKYYIVATELVWRIHAPYGIFVIPDEGITANDLLFSYKPSLPIKEQVGSTGKILIKILFNPDTGWFMYRGAIYFWMSLFFLIITFFRSRKYAVLVIATPMLLQVITIAAFPLVQDTRFMFPIILTAPVLIAIYFSPEFAAVNQKTL